MKKLFALLSMLILCIGSMWGQTSTITYSINSYSSDGSFTGTTVWNSNGTPTMTMTYSGNKGYNTGNGKIFQGDYTLSVSDGYIITSYSITGHCAWNSTHGDIERITPASGTITDGNDNTVSYLDFKGSDVTLNVADINSQSASFTMEQTSGTGNGAFDATAITITVRPIIATITIANCTSYTKASGCNHSLPSAYGTFSGQTFTTTEASGMANVSITASSGLTIGEQHVNVDNYGKCFRLVTAAASTNYTVTMTAPTGYVITGYALGCSANTKDAVHTLTSADGTVTVAASAPPYNSPTGPKSFEVTGLKANSTYFTINTANKGNTLYLPTFSITVKDPDYCVDVTYKVMFNGSEVASATALAETVGDAPALPSSLVKDYCTYTYYSDAACTTPVTELTALTTTVYAKCTAPFAASTTFNSATWYYLKLKDTNYPTYVADGTANVQLPADNAGNRTTQWAFFGNPYDGFTIKNRAAGDDMVLGSGSPASDGNNGGSTHATLQEAGSQTYELWYPASSTHYTNGFFLNNANDYALNRRNTTSLDYWTGGKDAGSTFVVEEAPSDEEYLETILETYTIDAANLGKPGFPTTAAYTTFRSAIEAYASIEDVENNLDTDLATLKDATIYPNGTYYIKNRHTGCYAFITDDGEFLPRIKIDTNVSHANNNYLWTVTSNKAQGTCSITSSMYGNIFAKGNSNTYASNTADNVTAITTLSTELFSSNNGTSGGFYLNGAHNNNNYKAATDDDGFVCNWAYQNSTGSQWIFEPVELGTAYTVTVNGLDDGGEDAVTLSDGTIVNLGTGTVYLSETPTTSNITQNAVSGYTILDGSIVVDTENHTITITYSPSYDVLISNYWDDNDIAAKIANAGQYGYPAITNDYTLALRGVQTALNGGSYTGNATNYNNLRTWYQGFLDADVVTPTAGAFYRFQGYSGNYITSNSASSNASMNGTASASNIIYLSEDNNIIFFNNGYGLYNTSIVAPVGSTLSTYTFPKGAQFGKLYVYANQNGSLGRYCYDNTSDGTKLDRNGSPVTSGNYQTDWTIEDITSLPVTLKASALGYATFCCPVPVKIPSGVEAFVSKIEDNTIKLFRIENFKDAEENVVIPANTAVMLHNKNFNSIDETFSFEIAEYSGEGITDNGFDGTIAAESMVAGNTYYSLRTWKVNDVPTKVGFATKTSGSLAGFKAWICEEGQSARNFTIVFDSDSDPTGIVEALGLEDANVEIYDLNGRKLSSYKRGINIVNGKKVMVK